MVWTESVVMACTEKGKRLLCFRLVCVQSQKGMDVSFTGILSTVEGIVMEGMNSETCTAADLCFSLQVSPYRNGVGQLVGEGFKQVSACNVSYSVLRNIVEEALAFLYRG